jgi:hypothetical protein
MGFNRSHRDFMGIFPSANNWDLLFYGHDFHFMVYGTYSGLWYTYPSEKYGDIPTVITP